MTRRSTLQMWTYVRMVIIVLVPYLLQPAAFSELPRRLGLHHAIAILHSAS